MYVQHSAGSSLAADRVEYCTRMVFRLKVMVFSGMALSDIGPLKNIRLFDAEAWPHLKVYNKNRD
jgi:hypothetical protein